MTKINRSRGHLLKPLPDLPCLCSPASFLPIYPGICGNSIIQFDERLRIYRNISFNSADVLSKWRRTQGYTMASIAALTAKLAKTKAKIAVLKDQAALVKTALAAAKDAAKAKKAAKK
jgi:hypothetical protein